MKCSAKTSVFFYFVAVFAILLIPMKAFAAPYNGEEFEFIQPDGSNVTVLLFGDEFHIDAESLDGYTLIIDNEGWVCYAALSGDGNEYVSTGIRYTEKSVAPPMQKKLRINKNSANEKRQKNRKALGDDQVQQPSSAPFSEYSEQMPMSAPSDTTHIKGITLIMEFPAISSTNLAPIKASVTRGHIDSVFNQPKFRGGQGSSVYDWYNDVSNGKMQYKNTIVPFVTVDNHKAYYDDNCSENYKMVQPLVHSALQKLKTEVESGRATLGQPSTVRQNNVNSGNPTVMALNIYFAGSSSCGWAKGIWPHQGWYGGVNRQKVTITEKGQTYHFYWYQISAMGTSNSITNSVNTVVHENGHMIMGWPDLYNYDSNNGITNVVGQYCVMSSGTAMPNPHFRDLAGWIDVVDITDTNAVLTHAANSHMAYKYRRNAEEYYLIEARRRADRSSSIPGEGLIVWHIHTRGNNTTVNASRPWPLVKIIQANNPNSTEQHFISGVGANSPFRSGGGSNNTSFSNITSPAARYYDGTLSNINLSQVSSVGNTMTFKIGSDEVILSSSSFLSVAPSSSSNILSSSSVVPSSSSNNEITPIILSRAVSENKVIAMKNAINLQVQNFARLDIYNLNGKLEKSLNFKSGVYEVMLYDLPKGMYIAKISFGKEKRIINILCL